MSILSPPLAPKPEPCGDLLQITQNNALVDRVTYLLEYGQDVVARLQPTHVHIAIHLAVQLPPLEAYLHRAQSQDDYAFLPVLVGQINDALAPGELLLREVEE
ncbi:MAG: hypothetical protein H0X24_02690 [Ktedonobacterales bacterium]|nr:hypothetical protein [Ktedonobacterales bacterium]